MINVHYQEANTAAVESIVSYDNTVLFMQARAAIQYMLSSEKTLKIIKSPGLHWCSTYYGNINYNKRKIKPFAALNWAFYFTQYTFKKLLFLIRVTLQRKCYVELKH